MLEAVFYAELKHIVVAEVMEDRILFCAVVYPQKPEIDIVVPVIIERHTRHISLAVLQFVESGQHLQAIVPTCPVYSSAYAELIAFR